ncbi:geranylgeranyl pyrophosphate synthase [Paracoccidioides brasiliensis Pb18]|uniref:Geranylgeranyl pyrophosphate synthase n=2 Tax=Paracoccidioides brasiliensis TaxID=121759 RepID=C1G208_PARBD|nr:geranylgeranyl pyrophosphate synthase [Paracoccidioides brasiliensis Pb18]EEH46024.1 geranylgeranyl pyrophosphate synthase [Paracoccidioides brasiliensis Pb18]ODH17283.1 geranylgeranyl pyrophosphate synthase [Paracoccidioides brasiliensis]ODH51563.1 geranylgeranyl pyrophosphate synthase [Paracoccidioides brasiliensis]
MPESLESPNPIPPRTSSTGVTNGIFDSTLSGSLDSSGSQNSISKPLPEAQWVAPLTKGRTSIPFKHTMGHTRNRFSIDGSKYDDGTWSPEKEKILLGPYDYMVQQPGKDIRRQLIAAFNRWLHVPEESLAIITKVVVMLHTASLLVDDVEDSSNLRRGVPVAHNIFGTAQTINSANYVYFLALGEVQKLRNPNAIDVYVKELLNLHRGQGMDVFWRDTLTCPTEEEYLDMVGNKTGGLFRLAIKLMQAESGTEIDCVALANLMGLIFQICDDYLNLSNSTYTKNKGLCEDLTEGKFSFPIIHSIRSHPDNLQLISILKQKTRDEEVKRYAVSYMESTGSFAYTRKTVIQLRERALLLIDALEKAAEHGPGADQTGERSGDPVRTILNKMVDATVNSECEVGVGGATS